MTSPTQVLKSVGPKLVPFFKTVAIYFVLLIPEERPSLFAMLIKCLPIISLIVFVLLHGMSLGDEYTFSRRILTGLLFSCLGDALLIWPHYFMHGMAAFGVAQIMYTAAFGFKPLNATLGAALYAFGATASMLLMPGLHGILAAGVPVYGVLLMTMIWRATARVQFFQELWTWTKLCSCAGGIVFAVSDILIGFHRFHRPIPHAQALIMITYYSAQLGIALSVVDSKASYNKAQANALASKEPAASTSSHIGKKIQRTIPLQ
ncbi:lysoplasmalogenase-like protein TMEM86A isoform X2 [Zootermopsis nevadensis]|uniref:lysoplasmalogenase-like protein TMEM86A isoform X2 n=1 Tax=Zootermopsis nevadensis TaxID=136037 RepID=UPI000B8E473A|nr:lysoplasmalogenase-like protein TMEM86A isoform X2 [Zootermopsis nevadensis]